MASAADIITYIGVPLAVLGVSPILYNFLVAFYVKTFTKHTLLANQIEAEIRSRFMNGIVEVDFTDLQTRIAPLSGRGRGSHRTNSEEPQACIMAAIFVP